MKVKQRSAEKVRKGAHLSSDRLGRGLDRGLDGDGNVADLDGGGGLGGLGRHFEVGDLNICGKFVV